MTRCICGAEITGGPKDITVIRRPCRCGLPERDKPTFGAPTVFIQKPKNPERAKLGLPDKTDYERGLDSRWV